VYREQFKACRSGKRQHAVMSIRAKPLTDEENA
jgi:cytochrome c553